MKIIKKSGEKTAFGANKIIVAVARQIKP
jgi:hypothetical protein